jgi:uncharacterized DUF497 family protein
MSGLRFAWDAVKAIENLRKHGVSFDEGKTIFSDPDELMLDDPDHSEEEERFISIGRASSGVVMLACYTEIDETVRLISVRKADAGEIFAYRHQGEQDA